jgi:cardiolipin synthase
MNKRKKKLFRIIYGRTIIVTLLLLVQAAVMVVLFDFLSDYKSFIYGGFLVLSAVVLFFIVNDRINPAYKLAWIIPVLLVPVFGSLFYIYVRLQLQTKWISRRYQTLIGETKPFLKQNGDTLRKLENDNPQVATTIRYMSQQEGYPVYENTMVRYFPTGEEMFEEIKRQLEKAEKYIFMEYFIIEYGYMWDSILDILERKAHEGIKVRVMYDGMCSLFFLPFDFPEELSKKGIRCKMFSPVIPVLTTYQNNRDHRKILVIDGPTAFTGGANIADEYINKKVRFGYWKDTSVMLKGDAARSFAGMFLQMWNITEKCPEDYSAYLPDHKSNNTSADGYVLPFGDSPFDGENTGEQVYLDIIHQATRYVHIMTPYLILDNELVSSLSHAAKSGIETIIIMPGIPDKPYAFWVAKTYYAELLEAGVRIFEYTPGFIHAKSFVSDDNKAVVGTINMDFRSLYLNFECAVYLYLNPEILKMEQDFQSTMKQSDEITLDSCKNLPLWEKIAGRMLRVLSPLM